MRKATLLLVIVIALWAATWWQTQPQWRVIQTITLTRQTQPIPQTTIFTPMKRGLYRLNEYMTAGGNPSSSWESSFYWTDLNHHQYATFISSQTGPSQLTYVFSPEPNTPISYNVSGSAGGYDLAIVIEQLQ